jgi:hypothetical protein
LNVRLKVNARGEHKTLTIANERVPSKEELNRILNSPMTFSGLRGQTLGNYTVTNGIRLGDFVEAQVNEEGVTFTKTPTMLVVRRGLSKAKGLAKTLRCRVLIPDTNMINGHKGDVEARYSTNKMLPSHMIEGMRKAYKECEPFL